MEYVCFEKPMKCPHCRETQGLHHDKIEIFERNDREKHGLHVTVTKGLVKIDTDISKNPSYRRHGLSIYFWCEICTSISVLSISQHKGEELINCMKIGEKNDCD